MAGIAQPPNPAIAVWAVASALRWVGVNGRVGAEKLLEGIAIGALAVWAIDELFRGVSPVRRVLGAGVLVFLVVQHLS